MTSRLIRRSPTTAHKQQPATYRTNAWNMKNDGAQPTAIKSIKLQRFYVCQEHHHHHHPMQCGAWFDAGLDKFSHMTSTDIGNRKMGAEVEPGNWFMVVAFHGTAAVAVTQPGWWVVAQ